MNSLPAIQRRVHAKARRLKLRVDQHQIFLTVPPRTSESHIQDFLKSSESWLIKVWAQHYQHTAQQYRAVTGDTLHLPALEKCFKLHLVETHDCHDLLIEGDIIYVNAETAHRLLKSWVHQQAIAYLLQRLDVLAKQCGFEYQYCSVRHAKTRWGSCSATKAISLNAALLLLPKQLIDYVILHELCHTRQLNHSAQFWQEMQRVDPDYLTHRQQLKQIKLPAWWHVSDSI